jgi:hypothetical protein
MRKGARWIACCLLFTVLQGMGEARGFTWKGQTIKGHFVTRDGRVQEVEDFIDLTEFHSLLYRREGILAPLPLVYIRRLTYLDGRKIQVLRKDGETLTVQSGDTSRPHCMVFTCSQAEATTYVHELRYTFIEAGRGERAQARISLCDVQEIAFD